MKKKLIVIAIATVAAATATAGIFLAKKYLIKPQIVGELNVLSYAPQGEGVPIDTDGITVMFNKAIVPLTTLDAGREKAVPLSITPSVKGKFFWLGTHGFTFRAAEPLTPATKYRVEMPPGLISVDGYRLDQPLMWEFSTVAPRVIQWEPADKEMLLPSDATLFLRFNLAMNRSDVESKLTITDAATDAPIDVKRNYIWGDDDHTLSVGLSDLPWDAKIVASITPQVLAAKGEIGMVEPFSVTYSTPEKIMTLREVVAVGTGVLDERGGYSQMVISPDKEVEAPAGSSICFVFSQPVEKKSFEKAFATDFVDAGKEGMKERGRPRPYFYFTDYEGYYTVDEKGRARHIEGYSRGCAAFLDEFDRSYTFSIDPAKIISLSGAPLVGGDKKYLVRTAHAKPELRSLLTKNILSTGGPLKIPYRGINLSAVTVNLYHIDKANYDEDIKDTYIVERESPADPPVSRPLGATKLELPYVPETMSIDQSRMPAARTIAIPQEMPRNVSARFLIDLGEAQARLGPGIYLVEAVPVPVAKVEKRPPAVFSMIQITPVALAIKREVDHVLVWATDIESGQPMENLPLKVHFEKLEKGVYTPVSLADAVTNAQGAAIIPSTVGEKGRVCAEVTDAARASYSCEDEHRLTEYRDLLKPGPHYFAYIYTDRPIYRPGQKVYFSSFVREVREGRYFMAPGKTPVAIEVKDPTGKVIYMDNELTMGPGGVISGSFELSEADDTPRGDYKVTIKAGRQEFNKIFVVASYRKPTFKVDLETNTPEIVSGEEMEVKVHGSYFFGAPMRKAKALWSIMTTTHIFAPEGFEGYSFIDEDLLHKRSGAEDDIEYASDFEYDVVASSWRAHDAEDQYQYDDPRGDREYRARGDFFEDPEKKDIQFIPDKLVPRQG